MSMELPVMLLLLSSATCLQEFLPGLPLKIPFLTGIAIYYALCRPAWQAGTVALWSGILQDALGGVPLGTTSWLLTAATLAIVAVRRVLLRESVLTAALLGGLLAGVQGLWQYAVVSRAFVIRPGAAWLGLSLTTLALSGVAAAALAFVCGRLLDRMAGNVKLREDVHGYDWVKTTG